MGRNSGVLPSTLITAIFRCQHTIPYVCSYYTMATLTTPEQELSKNPLKQGAGRYLVRYRRKHSNEEDDIETQLIKALCALERLDIDKGTHIGTSITEKRLHIVFDYGNLDHTFASINAYKGKGKKLERILLSPNVTAYINKRVGEWKRLHETQGTRLPIKDEIFPSGSTNPRAPKNLIRETGSAAPSRPTQQTKEDLST